MARRGENIYKRKDGRWEGRYKCGYSGNKTKYCSVYARTYQEVKEKLQKLKFTDVKYIPSGKRTVGELCNEWLKAVKLRVKASTYSCYQLKVNKYILPVFGDLLYEKLTVSMVHEFINSKLKQGLSVKYVRDIIVVFKSMVKYVSRVHNYADYLKNIILPKSEKCNMKLLSKSDQERLHKFISNNTDNTKLGVMLSCYMGLRIGEVCGLKWENIDFCKGTVQVNKTVQRIYENGSTRLIIGLPKSKSSVREIPLPYFLIEILKKFKGDNSAFILSGTSKPVEPRVMQYRFKSLLKKLNLPSVNYHSLRHMFATNCIELGFDIKTLSEILGHSSVEATLNRYVHSSMDRKFACMNLLRVS